jgi:hypothetical protein
MNQVSLKNVSGKPVTKGQQVRLVNGRKDSFLVASLGDTVIGTTAQAVGNNASCLINLLGTVDWNDITGKPATFASSSTSTTTSVPSESNSYFPSGW